MSFESVQAAFCRVVDDDPDRTALEVGATRLSYRELDERSSNLANFLFGKGAEPGSLVGVLSDDTRDVLTAILACLKGGLVFVPLDPQLPAARLALLVAEVEPDWILASANHLPLLKQPELELTAGVKLLPMAEGLGVTGDDDDGRLGAELAAFWDPRRRLLDSVPDQMCYVYFTSGSTGRPKGIAGRLKAIDHFIRWQIDTFGVDGSARVGQLTSPAFDASLRDFFLPLLVGGTVCAPANREQLFDPTNLAEWIDTERIGVLHMVPSLFRSLLSAELGRWRFEALRFVFLAGEPLLPSDVGRWHDLVGERVRLVNLYGPSETTMVKLFYPVEPEDRNRRLIPIGKPMRGARAVVVDAKNRPCAVGQIGEILLRTPFRSLGYFKRPELTAEVFVQSPFSDDPKDIVYRTGDLGRLLEDGNLEFLGRRDHQVKIRGVRVELAEIENHLRSHPDIVDLAVVDREDPTGSRYLCAYLVTRRPLDQRALREVLAPHLPEVSIPTAMVILEQLPRTISGKIDRRALPAPELSRRREATVAPRNETEELIASFWSEVLHLKEVGVADHFFEIGGHSLLATQVLARIRRVLGVEVPLRAFFNTPTVAGLATVVSAALSLGGGAEALKLERQPRNAALPLSFAQERLWFLDRLAPGNAAYNLGTALRLEGRLQVEALDAALRAIVARHETLRTTCRVERGRPWLEIQPSRRVALPVVDLCRITPPRLGALSERLASFLVRRPFDLIAGPLLRQGIVRLGEADHLLVLGLHHLITDGWSNEIFARELGELYAAAVEQRQAPFAELPIQYADFAVWQRRRLQGENLERLLAYWKSYLLPTPQTLSLPTDRPRPQVLSTRGAATSFTFSAALTLKLAGLCRAHQVTLFMTLMASFQVLLWRCSGQRDFAVGTPIAGRTHVETEGLIGLFANTLVIRSAVNPQASFASLLEAVREALLGAEAHQELPFEKMVEELNPRRDLSHSPLFQAMLVLQNTPRSAFRLPGLEISSSPTESVGVKFDLTLGLVVHGEHLQAYLEYNSELFDAISMQRLLGHLDNLLEDLVARPQARQADLRLFSAAEQAQLVDDWSNFPEEGVPELLLHELCARSAARHAGAPAVVFDGDVTTHGELDRAAEALAARLEELGVGPETVVGVAMERSTDLVKVLLAILKTGGAYLPLDPSFPPERLVLMVEDAAATLVITERRLEERMSLLGERGRTFEDLAAAAAAAGGVGRRPPSGAGWRNLAYLIYTSGSTGRPKGVGVSHSAVTNFLHAMGELLGFDRTDRWLAVTSLSFDISVLELFLPLVRGGVVEIASRESAMEGRALRRALEEGGATYLQATPSTWRLLTAADWRDAKLTALCGGEALPRALADELCGRVGKLWNLYGPTETAVWSTAGEIHAGGAAVPLGRPIANTVVCVVDGELLAVPPGTPGELLIGGFGVARGYHGQPAKTAEKFVPSAYSRQPGERLYRTGDLVRVNNRGELCYLGRLDQMVKLRGFRIEPGEVENLLERHPAVRQAVVVAREDAPGDWRLVAYLTPRGNERPRSSELLVMLREFLPDYMVPASFVWLEALPLTPNGKLDRRALPQPDRERPEVAASYVAPSSAMERAIEKVWREVLRLERVGARDNFFDLGGQSLLLIEVQSRLIETVGRDLPLVELFQYPTISALAAHLGGEVDRAREVEREERHVAGLITGRGRLGQRRAAFGEKGAAE